MELTTEQVEWIRNDIQHRGISMEDLAESLLDHVCCALEEHPGEDFTGAYISVMQRFGSNGLKKLQQETILLTILKNKVMMKKTMFMLGYIAALLTSTGFLFKVQHWPGAAVMLTLGVILLNFAFLPMYFYQLYKRSVALEQNQISQ